MNETKELVFSRLAP